ncbi:O-antigen ligase family protein [Roseomonas sp. OT10]|uniref:O-antigen ligase family protein n=1 Tax=Roseomonas cutis TaxID=2897332 RepID=UPI001E4613FA|nr:O-antigen ligase family protein [Roseomonas sp. OT10]UFN49758.1 O-antigen ligase family protein [Roseomonas sp. OT10]
MIRRDDLLALGGILALLGLLGAGAGATLAAGAVMGVALLAAILALPVIGVALMILAGTALQVLGSEHLTGLPTSLGKAAGAATLLAWAARSLLLRKPLTWSPQLPALAVFAAVLLLSTAWAPDPLMARDGLFRYVQLFLLFFMIANIAGEGETPLDLACLAFTGSMLVSSLIGMAEFLLPSLALESDDPSLEQGNVGAIIDRDSFEGVEIRRITGGLSDSNWFAYTLVAALPLNLYLLRRYQGPAMRGFILAAAALQSMGVVLSYTRSALIALAVSVLILLWRRRLPVMPFVLAAVIGSAGILAWNPPGLQRIFSPEYAREGSTPVRTYLLLGGKDLMLAQPLAGYGYGQYGPNFFRWLDHQHNVSESVDDWARELRKRVDNDEEREEYVMPHNTVVQIWVEYGLLGFIPFCAFVWFILRDLATARRHGTASQAELADCLLASTWGFLVCALFGHLAFLKSIWILGGLAAALRRVALTRGNPLPEALPVLRPAPR